MNLWILYSIDNNINAQTSDSNGQNVKAVKSAQVFSGREKRTYYEKKEVNMIYIFN